jgi:hypothetical protein
MKKQNRNYGVDPFFTPTMVLVFGALVAIGIPILLLGSSFVVKTIGLLFGGQSPLPGQVPTWAVIIGGILLFKLIFSRR